VPDPAGSGTGESGRGRRPGSDSEQQLARAREALAAARAAAGARPGRPYQRRATGAAQPGTAGDAPGPGSPGDAAPAPAAGTPSSGGADGDAAAAVQRADIPAQPTRAARRVRRDDPQQLSSAIGGLLNDEGWNLAAATGSVFGRWAQIVGPDLAGHTRPDSLRDGELTVQADSTAWATQLRLLAAQLVRRLNAELGPGTVQRVKVRGPVTADRKPGEWRVRGSRGPRDTYG
jgi:predicted nucleic acid-binding Zn ribbon protein